MFRIPIQFLPALHGLPEGTVALALLATALVLIFAGRSVIKVLAFVVVGLVGAAIGGTLGLQYLGAGGNLVGMVLGFVLGGLAGVLLVALGVGLLVGYAAYLLAVGFIPNATGDFIVGVVFFVVGLALAGEILSALTAVAGGILLFEVFRFYGLGMTMAGLIAALATVAGLWVQISSERHVTKTTATTAGGQTSDHH